MQRPRDKRTIYEITSTAENYTDDAGENSRHAISGIVLNESQSKNNVKTALARARISGRLNVSNMQLEFLPAEVYEYSSASYSVSTVDFEHSDDNEKWWEKIDLVKLDASSNRITSIDDQIECLPTLASIDLHDNKITTVSERLFALSPALTHLNLSRNLLVSMPDVLCRLFALQHLDLSYNAISPAFPDMIGNLTNLRVLLLNDNQLSGKLSTGIGFLRELTILNLSNNRLHTLPSELGSLTQLKQLDISHNELAELPTEVGCLIRLELLDASSNKLVTFPRLHCVNENSRLKALLLSFNRIGEITDENVDDLTMLPELQTLDVSDNNLRELSAKFYTLANLERLNVTNNQLDYLPDSIGLLPHLTHLLLDGNPLHRIRRDIIKRGTHAVKEFLRARIPDEDLQRMRTEMSSNNIGDVHRDRSEHVKAADAECTNIMPSQINSTEKSAELFLSSRSTATDGKLLLCKTLLNISGKAFWHAAAKKSKIYHVDLSQNALVNVPAGVMVLCRTLTELDLSHNMLTTFVFDACIASLVNLLYLNLSHNKLFSTTEDAGENQAANYLPALRELDISFNQFTSLPTLLLTHKCKLEILSVSDNHLRTLDDADIFRHMPKLANLDLSNNDIERVPPQLGLCTNIHTLKLEGNAFRVPRHDVLSKGTAVVLEYLRSKIAV